MTDDRPADAALSTSSLVHELRQPVFALRGRLQLLHERGAVGSGCLRELEDQLDHIESLLDYYGGVSSPPGPRGGFDVRVPVAEALALLTPRAQSAGIVVSADQPAKPVRVEGHPTALRQVLLNLLKNAIDAVSPARVREIVIRVSAGDEVWIVIEDTGLGVPDEVRPRLFDPFVTTKAPGEGTGLGLFISQQRVEELGGRVSIEPGQDGGTHATVVLPRAGQRRA